MNFTIEKGGAIPAPRPPRAKYPFAQMDVGDSFFVPFTSGTGVEWQRARSSANAHGKRYGMKFVTQLEQGGARVFRIE